MKHAGFFAITACAVGFASIASAQDMSKTAPALSEPTLTAPPPAMASAPRLNWTGAYVGAGVGYGEMSFSGAGSTSSAAAGLFAGYRQDMGGFVLGGEAIIVPTSFGGVDLPGGDSLSAGASVLGTAGMAFGPEGRTLGYVGLGPTLLRSSGPSGSETSVGGTATLGLDHMLTDSLMLRGGVNYTVVNNVGAADLNTRTLGAGVGLAFRF
jgi:outer membrane immunogenic protein